jgi:Na+-translocating ferredoxin:NAD+ oxidoreductase subunit B
MEDLMTTAVLSMVGLAIAFAAVLSLADRKLRVEDDPRVDQINRLLPGVNCGACGCLSCHDFAEHVVNEGADPGKCRVMHDEARKEICKLAGTEGGSAYPRVPLVRCAAETGDKTPEAEYRGIKTCGAAKLMFGGGMKCEYGCMGFGDCVKACPFGALTMVGGLPRLEQEKCTGCAKCAAACPRGIIDMVDKKNPELFYVACSSKDNTLRTRQVCAVGCIACGICVKLSSKGFFEIESNLSREDLSKQEIREECAGLAAKCPTRVIKEMPASERKG